MMNTRTRFAILACAAILCVAGLFVFATFEAAKSLQRAEQIYAEADSLHIQQSDIAQVLSYSRKFEGDERSSQPSGKCTPSDCLATVYAFPSHFLSRHPMLIAIGDRIGIHPFHAHVSLWVKNGRLDAVEKVFATTKEYGFGVHVSTTVSSPSPQVCKSPSYRLHPGYIVVMKYKRGGQVFEYWTDGSQPIPQMTLSCASTFRGCTAVSQVLPTTWAQYEMDQPRIGSLPPDPQLGEAQSPCR